MNDLVFRFAKPEDLPHILHNESDAYITPWRTKALTDCLGEQFLFYVMEVENQIIGHLILHPIVDECHLLNLCVNPQFQRRGFGEQALIFWLSLAQSSGWHCFLLEVRVTNFSAIKLYEKQLFREIGRRKNYYPRINGEREDGIVMQRVIEFS